MLLNPLFRAAFNLDTTWEVNSYDIEFEKAVINFEFKYTEKKGLCPHCKSSMPIHDRKERAWRHVNFFHFKTYIKAKIPRVKCSQCQKVSQLNVSWARPDSGFTHMFESVTVSFAQMLPMLHVSKILDISDKQVYRQIEYHVNKARALETYDNVKIIGIDETSIRKGHNYITLVHDLESKRLLFTTEGRKSSTLKEFVKDFTEHQGVIDKIEHACIDMSPAYIKGVNESIPNAQISFDAFHVVALVTKALEQVRKDELSPKARKDNAIQIEKKNLKRLHWGIKKNPENWNDKTRQAMEEFKSSNLKTARVWRMKESFRDICKSARKNNDKEWVSAQLKAWINWARRSKLEPFKELGLTLRKHFDGIVRGLLDNRSNAYVEAMNGALQQVKRAAKGYRNPVTFMTIAYLRMGKFKNLPKNPMYKSV